MAGTQVGVQDLVARLGEYLELVKAGQTVVITEHGREVGRIIPAPPVSLEDKLWAMVDAGLAKWNGRRFAPQQPVARTRGEKTVADLLIEDRGHF
jgi:prevent-host-death family protein